jgi:hypothetical protein
VRVRERERERELEGVGAAVMGLHLKEMRPSAAAAACSSAASCAAACRCVCRVCRNVCSCYIHQGSHCSCLSTSRPAHLHHDDVVYLWELLLIHAAVLVDRHLAGCDCD